MISPFLASKAINRRDHRGRKGKEELRGGISENDPVPGPVQADQANNYGTRNNNQGPVLG